MGEHCLVGTLHGVEEVQVDVQSQTTTDLLQTREDGQDGFLLLLTLDIATLFDPDYQCLVNDQQVHRPPGDHPVVSLLDPLEYLLSEALPHSQHFTQLEERGVSLGLYVA